MQPEAWLALIWQLNALERGNMLLDLKAREELSKALAAASGNTLPNGDPP